MLYDDDILSRILFVRNQLLKKKLPIQLVHNKKTSEVKHYYLIFLLCSQEQNKFNKYKLCRFINKILYLSWYLLVSKTQNIYIF